MSWPELFDLVTWHDLLDVLVIAVLFYNLLLLIRGTRAVQMLVGLVFVAAAYAAARFFELSAFATLIEKFLLVLPFALIVLFQQELRRALANFGRGPFLGFGTARTAGRRLSDLVLAATTFASRRTGALIVFERRVGLRNYIENGIALDALVSFDLLVSLFTPDTPLHDGAVIVQGDRLAAASCFLPLTTNPEQAKAHGSRHRAALGISEETDAVALVVSEESGDISIAVGGSLEHGLDATSLAARLNHYLIVEERLGGRPGKAS